MVCYTPVRAYQAAMPDETGKRPIFFVRGRNDVVDINLACGQCVGCRLERSRQWAVRCMHESKLYSKNCFITLTYSDKFLPPSRSLVIKDVQDFMKRLRKRYGSGIRVFYCGEYGPKLGRPHYHAILFNMDFDDRKPWDKTKDGHQLYTSTKLDELWQHKGFTTVGDVSFQSAAYCARYAMKKVNGAYAEMHYAWLDTDTNTWHWKRPEFAAMSRRGGIGTGYMDKFGDDVYPSDFIIVNGVRSRPPRFYDEYFSSVDPLGMEEIKFQRAINAGRHADNNTTDRLKVRRELAEIRLERLKRQGVV